MELAAWLVPMLMSLVGTGVSTITSAVQSNKQLDAQAKAQQQQLDAQQRTVQSNAEQSRSHQMQLNQQTVDNFKRSMNIADAGLITGNTTGMNIQGLNGQQGYLNEEDKTIYANRGGKFVSANNSRVLTTNNDIDSYRDRVAALKFGGRKCC